MARAFENGEDFGLTTNRIEALSDGIFAISMTLLVLSLSLPENIGQETLFELLSSRIHVFFAYVLSFILLAVFWLIHHKQFHIIVRSDKVLLWINIIILMFVALMPFSTSIMGDYPSEPLAKGFFDMNMFILGVLFYLSWRYASGHHRLIDPNLPQWKIDIASRRALIIPIVSLIAFSLAFISVDISSLAYFLIPAFHLVPYFRESSPAAN